MNKKEAFKLFNLMIRVAEKKLFEFTLNNEFNVEQKADKSVVTACDKAIDQELTKIVNEAGLQTVSEEGEHVLNRVESGNYITIDPIDGSLGYVEYVNHAIENGGIRNFLKKDLGAKSDFCLLLGIVENSKPRFGACYNFITKEKILIDAQEPESLIRENNVRNYQQKNAVYVDQRKGDCVEDILTKMEDIEVIKQAALGLKSLYTILNEHQNAITSHRVQSAGLWDIMPAAVAAEAFGGIIYDDNGEELQLDKYILLPGLGATIIKGDKFTFILNELRKKVRI